MQKEENELLINRSKTFENTVDFTSDEVDNCMINPDTDTWYSLRCHQRETFRYYSQFISCRDWKNFRERNNHSHNTVSIRYYLPQIKIKFFPSIKKETHEFQICYSIKNPCYFREIKISQVPYRKVLCLLFFQNSTLLPYPAKFL